MKEKNNTKKANWDPISWDLNSNTSTKIMILFQWRLRFSLDGSHLLFGIVETRSMHIQFLVGRLESLSIRVGTYTQNLTDIFPTCSFDGLVASGETSWCWGKWIDFGHRTTENKSSISTYGLCDSGWVTSPLWISFYQPQSGNYNHIYLMGKQWGLSCTALYILSGVIQITRNHTVVTCEYVNSMHRTLV